nr:MAG TPA: hypothetical protein [Caudoviricetes sp.]
MFRTKQGDFLSKTVKFSAKINTALIPRRLCEV